MPKFTVMTWNVENLFQFGEESGPKTQAEYTQKLQSLAQVILQLEPDVLGLQEIGSLAALNDLVNLLQNRYPHVQISDNPDPRGIRVGFLSKLEIKEHEEIVEFPQSGLPTTPGIDSQGNLTEVTRLSRGALRILVEPKQNFSLNAIATHLKSKLLSFPSPTGGSRFNPKDENERARVAGLALLKRTAEAVAKVFSVSREDQDEFSLKSHKKAVSAIESGKFKDEIVPIEVTEIFLDASEKRQERKYVVDTDEGPRKDSTKEALAKLKPVFDARGSVTAGNSSQTSDGAAFVMIVSEKMLKELNVKPLAKLLSYHVSGLEPRIMGVGPIYAIPEAVKKAGLQLSDIDLFELNEAFASQSLAVIRELGLDPSKINVNGGAIALGHPLGCTGAKLTVQLMNEMRRQNKKYGVVTMCVGTGQGAAGVFELL
jgi:hypothetical protein